MNRRGKAILYLVAIFLAGTALLNQRANLFQLISGQLQLLLQPRDQVFSHLRGFWRCQGLLSA